MENDLTSFDFSKSKPRKCWQSIQNVFGLPEENDNDDDDDYLNEKESNLLEDKKPFSVEKLKSTTDFAEDKDALRSKKMKKTEAQPPAIKTFCRIRPTDSKNGILNFIDQLKFYFYFQ